MECAGFIEVAWNFANNNMLLHLLLRFATVACGEVSYSFANHPIQRNIKVGVCERGKMFMTSSAIPSYNPTREDRKLRWKFATLRREKNGYELADRLNQIERQVLRFLATTLSPVKPYTFTVKLAKAILKAYTRRRECGWALILEVVLDQEVGKVRRSKFALLVPILYDTYPKFDCLTEVEQIEYEDKL